ncbi:MAG: arginine--tRNA ligase, partial [Dehalococcoidales bacterium]|nr:arginine--tRNA ligase [Dehalococcoidales bacterium]
MLKETITELIIKAIIEARQAGKLPELTLPEIAVERPQNPEHGDYASSISLKLARAVGTSPLAIANEIAGFIKPSAEIESVTVAPPGFINFTLKNDWLVQQVDAILESGEAYGNIELGQGKRIQIEFVSVNPTGPLHVGHGRGAILGSTLANALTSADYKVEKEYYINDAGNQVDAFRRSLYARYRQALGEEAEMPADGYLGNYIIDMVKEIIAEEGGKLGKLSGEELISRLGQIGLDKMLSLIKADLELLDVTFDVWFSEQSLYDNKQYETAIESLKKGGYIAEREGATWFVSTA